MTIRLSYDEGKTWPVSRLVWNNRSSYSCLTILPDGTIGLLFEKGNKENTRNRHHVHRLTFVRCNLEWLTEGKDALRERVEKGK
jgi:sialidase-1